MSNREVVVYDSDDDGELAPPQKAGQFVCWLMQLVETAIPAEFREAATIDISARDGDYNDSSPVATLRVAYVRPETPKEGESREAFVGAIKSQEEKFERGEFERLKRKFGG